MKRNNELILKGIEFTETEHGLRVELFCPIVYLKDKEKKELKDFINELEW